MTRRAKRPSKPTRCRRCLLVRSRGPCSRISLKINFYWPYVWRPPPPPPPPVIRARCRGENALSRKCAIRARLRAFNGSLIEAIIAIIELLRGAPEYPPCHRRGGMPWRAHQSVLCTLRARNRVNFRSTLPFFPILMKKSNCREIMGAPPRRYFPPSFRPSFLLLLLLPLLHLLIPVAIQGLGN
jgi:hypothetical protein